MVLIYTKNNENILKPINLLEEGLKEYNLLLEQHGDNISSISLVTDTIAFFGQSENGNVWEEKYEEMTLIIKETDHIDALEGI